MEVGGRLRALAALPPGERTFTHRILGLVGPKTVLDDVERRKILPTRGLELQPLRRPARNQSLYRLPTALPQRTMSSVKFYFPIGISMSIILPVVLCVYEPSSRTLREEHRQSV
jgi:hypothetical protein